MNTSSANANGYARPWDYFTVSHTFGYTTADTPNKVIPNNPRRQLVEMNDHGNVIRFDGVIAGEGKYNTGDLYNSKIAGTNLFYFLTLTINREVLPALETILNDDVISLIMQYNNSPVIAVQKLRNLKECISLDLSVTYDQWDNEHITRPKTDTIPMTVRLDGDGKLTFVSAPIRSAKKDTNFGRWGRPRAPPMETDDFRLTGCFRLFNPAFYDTTDQQMKAEQAKRRKLAHGDTSCGVTLEK